MALRWLNAYRLPFTRSTFAATARPSSTVCPTISRRSFKMATPSTTTGDLDLRPRLSSDRGQANLGWLNSYHTFSFADYHDPSFSGVSSLRVINEDRVEGGKGFGRHSHRDFEIFSYVVGGKLKHDDSLGNSEILTRGDVQFTSAGKGIAHSEFNGDAKEMVHFLQMWVKPHTRGLAPNYQTKRFTDEDKRNQLRLLISPTGEQGSITINQDCNVYATLLDHGASVSLDVAAGRRAYVHVVMDVTGLATEKRETGVTVSSDGGESAVKLQDGDGCFVELRDGKQSGRLTLTGHSLSGSKAAEVIVFELA